jgi:fructose-1,6-bisphosphatase/inositol monophosphatase family enzyme
VAKGTAVAALHRNAKVWDLAGAQAIMDAVGGRVVHLDGTPFSMATALSHQGIVCQPVLAGHPAVLEKLLPHIEVRRPDSGEIETDSVKSS